MLEERKTCMESDQLQLEMYNDFMGTFKRHAIEQCIVIPYLQAMANGTEWPHNKMGEAIRMYRQGNTIEDTVESRNRFLDYLVSCDGNQSARDTGISYVLDKRIEYQVLSTITILKRGVANRLRKNKSSKAKQKKKEHERAKRKHQKKCSYTRMKTRADL